MTIIGYGEDSLTYQALSSQLERFLQGLGDNSPSASCRVYYRPSFGRSGGSKSSQFGEFDAILASQEQVYLIETKWDSGAKPRPSVCLKEVQILRHRIFRWLYSRWIHEDFDSTAMSWNDFVEMYDQEFSEAFPYRSLAPPSSLLARNLTHILTDLAQSNRPLQDIVLYFHGEQHQPPDKVVNSINQPIQEPTFTLVTLPYCQIGNSGYFQMVP